MLSEDFLIFWKHFSSLIEENKCSSPLTSSHSQLSTNRQTIHLEQGKSNSNLAFLCVKFIKENIIKAVTNNISFRILTTICYCSRVLGFQGEISQSCIDKLAKKFKGQTTTKRDFHTPYKDLFSGFHGFRITNVETLYCIFIGLSLSSIYCVTFEIDTVYLKEDF